MVLSNFDIRTWIVPKMAWFDGKFEAKCQKAVFANQTLALSMQSLMLTPADIAPVGLLQKKKAQQVYQLNVVCKSALTADQALANFWRVCNEYGLQEQHINLVRHDGLKQVRLSLLIRCDALQRRALVKFVRDMDEVDAVRQISLITAPVACLQKEV